MNEEVNPALRVLRLLQAAEKIPNNRKERNAWSELLGVDSDNTREILTAIADFIRLVNKARNALDRVENVNKEIYLAPFSSIDNALSEINLNANWQTFTKHLDQATMTSLKFCADTLRSTWNEISIDKEELPSLLKNVQDLILDVMNSSYHPELKAVILDSLRTIEQAILAYDLRGSRGIKNAIESSLGSLLMAREEIQSLPEDKKSKGSIIARVFKCLNNLNSIITFTKGVHAIAPSTIGLITGPNGS